MKYLKSYEYQHDATWSIIPPGSIVTGNNIYSVYDFSKDDGDELNAFLHWLNHNILSFTIHDKPGGHNFATDRKDNNNPKFGLKISDYTVVGLCTNLVYTIGEGMNINDAINDYINKIKGEVLEYGYDDEFINIPKDFIKCEKDLEIEEEAEKFNI